MGIRSGALICQRVTTASLYIFKKLGYRAVCYIDDYAGAEINENALKADKSLQKIFLINILYLLIMQAMSLISQPEEFTAVLNFVATY